MQFHSKQWICYTNGFFQSTTFPIMQVNGRFYYTKLYIHSLQSRIFFIGSADDIIRVIFTRLPLSFIQQSWRVTVFTHWKVLPISCQLIIMCQISGRPFKINHKITYFFISGGICIITAAWLNRKKAPQCEKTWVVKVHRGVVITAYFRGSVFVHVIQQRNSSGISQPPLDRCEASFTPCFLCDLIVILLVLNMSIQVYWVWVCSRRGLKFC